MIRLFRFIRAARTVNDHAGNIRQAVDETTAGFTYSPRQIGKSITLVEDRIARSHAQLAAVAPDGTLRAQYLEALVVLVTSGLMPWQMIELAGFFRRSPVAARIIGNPRRQTLAEAAEFLRPASYYEAKPHKAAGDVARLQEWLAGQGVEVTE